MPGTAPFTLTPSLAERVWGGRRLGPGIGEAWDLSVHPNGPSIIGSGPDAGRSLAEVNSERPHDFGGPVDLLAKRLDCAENLSVQVHPRTGDPKTEAWVVLAAEPGAGVYLGFRDTLDADTVRVAALDGSLPELMDFVGLSEGDAVFIPAGTVHAIGGGLALFELQQSSDTTYRLFDWGRTGRELHLDDGLACADLVPSPDLPVPVELAPGAERLVECPFFFIDRISAGVDGVLMLDPGERWVAVHTVAGAARCGDLVLHEGATLLVPASAEASELEPDEGFVGLRYGPSGTSAQRRIHKP
jgi:mannose-6-phosphate isomerase